MLILAAGVPQLTQNEVKWKRLRRHLFGGFFHGCVVWWRIGLRNLRWKRLPKNVTAVTNGPSFYRLGSRHESHFVQGHCRRRCGVSAGGADRLSHGHPELRVLGYAAKALLPGRIKLTAYRP